VDGVVCHAFQQQFVLGRKERWNAGPEATNQMARVEKRTENDGPIQT